MVLVIDVLSDTFPPDSLLRFAAKQEMAPRPYDCQGSSSFRSVGKSEVLRVTNVSPWQVEVAANRLSKDDSMRPDFWHLAYIRAHSLMTG
jgi:hypothetical protein